MICFLKFCIIFVPRSFFSLSPLMIDSNKRLRLYWLTLSLKFIDRSNYYNCPVLSSRMIKEILLKKSTMAELLLFSLSLPCFMLFMISKNSLNSIVPDPSRSTAKLMGSYFLSVRPPTLDSLSSQRQWKDLRAVIPQWNLFLFHQAIKSIFWVLEEPYLWRWWTLLFHGFWASNVPSIRFERVLWEVPKSLQFLLWKFCFWPEKNYLINSSLNKFIHWKNITIKTSISYRSTLHILAFL